MPDSATPSFQQRKRQNALYSQMTNPDIKLAFILSQQYQKMFPVKADGYETVSEVDHYLEQKLVGRK